MNVHLGSRGGLVDVNCGQVRTSNHIRKAKKPYSVNEVKMDLDEEEEMNNIIIDDYNDDDRYQASTVRNHDHKSFKNSIDHFSRKRMDDSEFDTYDFVDSGAIYYNVDNGKQLEKFTVNLHRIQICSVNIFHHLENMPLNFLDFQFKLPQGV